MTVRLEPKCGFLPCRNDATMLLVHDDGYPIWSCVPCADYWPDMVPAGEIRLTLDQVTEIANALEHTGM